MGFYPRKRARSNVPHVKSWPATEPGSPKLQGFAGYKAGMTHALIVDYRPASVTAGQEVRMPCTVIEAPPMTIAAIRFYENTPYGAKTLTEVWADKQEPRLDNRLPLAEKPGAHAADKWKLVEESLRGAKTPSGLQGLAGLGDVRVLAHTNPVEATGPDHKIPELMEIRVGGGELQARVDFAKTLLGKTITVDQAMKAGQMMDTLAVTKGYGFESRVVRFHTKLLSHKNSKHRRMIGTQGSWHPNWVQHTVPNDGQRGFHQRTEYNKRILKIGSVGAEVTPEGGFPHYGVVRNHYLLVHGSIPGPAKRLVRMRDAVRYSRGIEVTQPDIRYVSTASKQGV